MCSNSVSSHKSDMWMLGCILYELCSLERPFAGQNISNVIYKILHEKQAPIPRQYNDAIKSLVDQLLQKNPIERPNIDDILRLPEIVKQINILSLKYPETHSKFASISNDKSNKLEVNGFQNDKETILLKSHELSSFELEEEKGNISAKDRTISTKDSSMSSIQSPTTKTQRKANAIQTLIEQKRSKLGSGKVSPTDTYSIINKDSLISSPPQKSNSMPSNPENNLNAHDLHSNKLNESSRKNQKLVISIPEMLENEVKIKEEKNEELNLQSSLSPSFHQSLINSKSMQARKKSSFSEQVFDPLSPGSPNRPFFAARFLKSQLGEERYENLQELIEKHENPKRLLNEESSLVLEILGENNNNLLKTIEYLVWKRIGNMNGPPKQGGQTFKSPASATSKFKQTFSSEINLDGMKQETPKSRQSIWNPLNKKSKTQVLQNNKTEDTG